MSAPTLGAAVLVALFAPAQHARSTPAAQFESPAEVAFERAAKLQRAARRESGPAQRSALADAAQAFSALRGSFPGEHEWAARASFRAVGLWRQLGDGARERIELERLCSFESPPSWRSRGWLERGHVERRARRWRDALDAYLRAASVVSAPTRTRDEAGLWASRMHTELGELDAARRLLEWISVHARDVFQRIRAFDEWALGYVREGDLAAAAGVLERARAATRQLAFEATPRGERVLLALARMRVIAALEAAVARGAGAGGPKQDAHATR